MARVRYAVFGIGSALLAPVLVGASFGSAAAAPAATARAVAATDAAAGSQADRILGNGLARLLDESRSGPQRRATGGLQINQESLAIRDAQGRVLIQAAPRAGVDAAAYRRSVEALGLSVESVEATTGLIEGFAPLSAVRPLAALATTGSIAQSLRPIAHVGDATSQGVSFQRIDRVHRAGVDGSGVTIGALSDSYDTAALTIPGQPLTIRAADDVASGDLPGPANPRNRQSVVVIEDAPTDETADEGRGMLQIAHDVAPGSKLCFATAWNGEIGFAENIRRLADPGGPCAADVVVDDITYLGEPMFSDGPIADAVDDVTAQGVDYFSSAGNQGDRGAWQSPVRLVPARRGIAGTNLDFSGVDPALYSGGLQDMNPGRGLDVAQTMSIDPAGGTIDLQWDDPVDVNGAEYGEVIFSATGEITQATPEPSFEFTPTADQVGTLAEFRTDAIPSGTTDLVLTVVAPDGTVVGQIDTGASPETLATTLEAGSYTIIVSGFGGATGDFTVDVRPIVAPSDVTTDFNLLIFASDGSYLGAIADANPLTGRPFEVGGFTLPESTFQLVIARAGTGPVQATRLRYVLFDGMYVSEFFDPLAPSIFGHHMAKGATAVAAYDPFRPYLPEAFTSAGGDLVVYFDSSGERYPTPQVRRVPQVASADGGNNTFFAADSALDADDQPNFFGTSAAAPHAAAIAALLLEAAGGPDSLTPAQVRARLQRSTFAHDLDPNHAQGSAGGLTVSADGQLGDERDADPGAMIDPRFFDVTYTGKVPLRSITFLGETADPTALRTSKLNGGLVFDPRPVGEAPRRDDGFPFTVGATSGGLAARQVSAQFSVPATVAGQYRHLTVTFAGRGLARGQGLSFGVDRDQAVPAAGLAPQEGNGADELGGATFIPQRRPVPKGLVFVAERVDGSTVTGVMRNRLGTGWTPLDGYGVVDAERAVLGR